MRVAEAAAVILAVAPHLVRPLQRANRWIIAFGLVGGLFVDTATPGGNVSAVLVGVVAAAGVRLAFGTSAGQPSLEDVGAAIAQLGVRAGPLQAAERHVAGVFIAEGHDERGARLLVKVYGRDAFDTRLVARFWRAVWYRDPGPALGLSRDRSVEHEAFITLLARQAGVPTYDVVTAGATVRDDAVLVLRDRGHRLSDLPAEELDDGLLRDGWRTLAALHGANIAHLGIDASALVVEEGRMGLVDFAGAAVAAGEVQMMSDRAQLLAVTACVAGYDRAVRAAVDSLGAGGIAALLPYLQAAAFGRALRRDMKAAGIQAEELRSRAAAAVAVEPPELVRLRRLTVWSFVQVALLMLAASAVISFFGGIDFQELADALADANWAWIAVAFVVAQLPRFTQAVSTLGSIPASLPYGPVYAMQLTTCYMNLALPSYAGRLAVNIRFFQRQGLPPPVAVTSGAIDSFASTIVQGGLLALLLLFSSATVSLDLNDPSASEGSTHLLWVIAAAAVASVIVLVVVRRVRRALAERIRRWWPEVRKALRTLRSGNKLVLLLGGAVATEVLFATALGLFARGLGYTLALSTLLVINISVSLLSSFIPVPGGIGVTEFGLTVGLVSAGMPEEAALAATLLYRISTFYLPPVWGFFAMRWLQRNGDL